MAQARLTGADLQGVVRDESKAVLPGAVVTAVNRDTNLTRTATSDAQGRFVLAALPPGTYKITVALQGFATADPGRLGLQLGQSVELDFTMKVAGGKEELTVVAEAPGDRPLRHLGLVGGGAAADREPAHQRAELHQLLRSSPPGSPPTARPQQGASATSGLSFTGQRARSNNIMVDGLDNNDAVGGRRSAPPSARRRSGSSR